MPNPQLIKHGRVETVTAPDVFEQDENMLLMVIETYLWPEWERVLYQHVAHPEYERLFDKTDYRHIKEGPVVVRLPRSEAEQAQGFITRCMEQMQQLPCGCFFYVQEEESPAVVDVLRSNLLVSDGVGQVFLRYYDPRALLPLLSCMNDEERGLFYYGIRRVIWFDSLWLGISVPQSRKRNLKDYQWVVTPEHKACMQHTLDQW